MNTSIQIRLHEFQTTVVANVERTPKRRTARIIIDFFAVFVSDHTSTIIKSKLPYKVSNQNTKQ